MNDLCAKYISVVIDVYMRSKRKNRRRKNGVWSSSQRSLFNLPCQLSHSLSSQLLSLVLWYPSLSLSLSLSLSTLQSFSHQFSTFSFCSKLHHARLAARIRNKFLQMPSLSPTHHSLNPHRTLSQSASWPWSCSDSLQNPCL